MDRLTFEGDFCTIAMCQENPCPYDNSCTQREVWERLKAYEDTGLEPETCAEYKKFEDEAVSKGVTFKRIIELMEAEKDGRLVVHGRWVSGPSDVLGMDCEFCSVCGQGMNDRNQFWNARFCPNCGAKMDLEV